MSVVENVDVPRLSSDHVQSLYFANVRSLQASSRRFLFHSSSDADGLESYIRDASSYLYHCLFSFSLISLSLEFQSCCWTVFDQSSHCRRIIIDLVFSPNHQLFSLHWFSDPDYRFVLSTSEWYSSQPWPSKAIMEPFQIGLGICYGIDCFPKHDGSFGDNIKRLLHDSVD